MATALRGTIIARVQTIIGSLPAFSGDNEIGESDMDEALTQAVKSFSLEKPYEVVEDEVGDSGKFYPLSNLASWENDFSRIISIDYDAGTRVSSDEMPQYLSVDDGEWRFYEDGSGVRYLHFPYRSPSSSVTYRVKYTAFHTLTDVLSTIPKQYEEAILYLAISRFATQIRIHIEKGLENSAGGDYPSLRNRGSGFSSLSDTYAEMYREEMGGSEVVPASAFRETDLRALSGRPFLHHAGGRR